MISPTVTIFKSYYLKLSAILVIHIGLYLSCVVPSVGSIYCAFARNSADSLYFVPYFLLDGFNMAPINMTGKWKLDRSENFEDMLKALEMGFMARKIALAITPVHTIEQDDDRFNIKISTPRGTQEMKFKIGEEFNQKVLAYQGEFKCVPQWEGNVLVITYNVIEGKNKSVKETREIINDEYILTIYIGDVICKRIFKRST